MPNTTQDSNAAPDVNVNDVNQDQNQNNVDDVNDTSKDSVAYDTYRRNVGKLKKTQSELDEAHTKLRKLEQDRLESEGKKDELIASLRTEVDDWRGKHDKKSASFAYATISSQVEREAAKMGCQDTDLLLMAVNNDLATLDVGDDYKLDGSQVKTMIEKIKTEKPFLFSKPQPNVQDGVPNGKPDVKQEGYLDELKKCTTQAQFDAVRAKYKRN